MLELTIFFGSFLVTYFGVRWFRAWTLRRGVLDHPNERSSHTAPTPRGGGLVVAVVILMAYVLGSWLLDFEISVGFLAGSLVVVAVSWLDDVYSISFVWRLLVQSAAAACVMLDLGHLSTVATTGSAAPLDLGMFGVPITFLWIIWLVNAYNFMDGIDGIAGIQAVAAASGWLLAGLASGSSAVFILSGTVLLAALAFLLHNWSPARIFMGDAGSAFLGFTFASMPLMFRSSTATDNGTAAFIGILVVWMFIFDSVFTIIRRLINGEKVWQAHRQHLYQRLVISGYSHQRTTLIYGVFSLAIAISAGLSAGENPRIPTYIALVLAAAASIALLGICHARKGLFGGGNSNG